MRKSIVRLLKAGAVLGLFQVDGRGRFDWSPTYRWVRTDQRRWEQLIAIVRHQLSYLNLVDNSVFWSGTHSSPATQLKENPSAYEDFLRGVASSHRNHALWISRLEELGTCRSMADVGGGLGTYAMAWVTSSRHRSAILIDLPAIAPFVSDSLKSHDGRLRFMGADLYDPLTLPEEADFVLFADVLHLIPAWPRLLKEAAACARLGCLIGVFEADPNTPQGTVFDLQVHLRSGCTSNLLDAATMDATLASIGLKNVRRLETLDREDPFRRAYRLWLGEV